VVWREANFVRKGWRLQPKQTRKYRRAEKRNRKALVGREETGQNSEFEYTREKQRQTEMISVSWFPEIVTKWN
jgi:hypothetical protein